MSLKDRIREAMEGSGLKPLQLANACSVSSGAVTHWLNGGTKALKAETALQIEAATGYSANWLITGSGETFKSKRNASKTEPDIYWPFDLIGLTKQRYEALPISSRYAVQALMLQAIEKQEAALRKID